MSQPSHSPVLHLDVFTSPARSFASSAIPEGEGDEAVWSPSSSTLIYGHHDAVLVDVPVTKEQVADLADWIESKGKNLRYVYVTHGHGDHWLGLAHLSKRFPGVRGLATAEVLARATFEATDAGIWAYWTSIFPGETPTADEVLLPDLLRGESFDLEGNDLQIIRIGQADTANSTVLYVPTLGAVVTGDLAYNEVHMMTAETDDRGREAWIANLGEIADLKPKVVVAGHKRVENADDAGILVQSQQYLRDFTTAVNEQISVADVVARMVVLYPSWQNRRTLWHSARAAKAATR